MSLKDRTVQWLCHLCNISAGNSDVGNIGGPLCYIGINLDPSKPKGMPLGLKLHSAKLHTASLPKYIYKASVGFKEKYQLVQTD